MSIGKLESTYKTVVNELYQRDDNKEEGLKIVDAAFNTIKSFTSGKFTQAGENTIRGTGRINFYPAICTDDERNGTM
jgi:aspartate kinase